MDLFPALFSNLWAIFLIVLFFGGSIFVHELGHFLAARRRGLKVTRFSIGFGPKIFGWTGRDGVEYRLSWIPLGGYVALPQLADLGEIEGRDPEAERLPPLSYSSKMIVAAAGAFFNLLFAFALATIIWFVGQPTTSDQATTEIGYVVPTIRLADGTEVTSPAVEAGLRIGDRVRAIDGRPTADWNELLQTLVTSAGRTRDGRRYNVFAIERDGTMMDVTVYPGIATDERIRRVGIAPAYELIVYAVQAEGPGALAGLEPGDQILALDGESVTNVQIYVDWLAARAGETVRLTVERAGQRVELSVPPRPAGTEPAELGVSLTTGSRLIYPAPWLQFSAHVSMTFRTLGSLINPQSDIGLSKLSGPVGIVRVFHLAAQADLRLVLWFTILVNINLAIFNLLPIPVLDGGHMLFATLSKLRGRALPANFIMTTQSLFMVLLFAMVIYVSFFDVRRLVRANSAPPPAAEDPAEK